MRATPAIAAAPARLRDGHVEPGTRLLAQETAIAFTYRHATHAVMLASPGDLDDFAVGFTLNEGIVASPAEIETLEIVEQTRGIELRMWLAEAAADALARRHRRLAGATGCGLCGIESLEAALAPPRRVTPGARFLPADLLRAVASLPSAQPLFDATRAVHAAAFWRPERGIIAVREDVGRHNALDKLAGALARAGEVATGGVVLLTSRVSVEMVQKAAMMDAAAIVAVSAPTALAVHTAEEAGIMLAGVARSDGLEIFARREACGVASP